MELFERTTAPDERPYLGDVPFLLYVARLRDGGVPLLTERDGAFELDGGRPGRARGAKKTTSV